MFCKHDWKVISQTTTESKYEHAMKIIKDAGVSGKISIPPQLCDAERKHIAVFSCIKCGKMNRFVESI